MGPVEPRLQSITRPADSEPETRPDLAISQNSDRERLAPAAASVISQDEETYGTPHYRSSLPAVRLAAAVSRGPEFSIRRPGHDSRETFCALRTRASARRLSHPSPTGIRHDARLPWRQSSGPDRHPQDESYRVLSAARAWSLRLTLHLCFGPSMEASAGASG